MATYASSPVMRRAEEVTWPLLSVSEIPLEHFMYDAALLLVCLSAWVASKLWQAYRKAPTQKEGVATKSLSPAVKVVPKMLPTSTANLAQTISQTSDPNHRQCGRALELFQKFQGSINWSSLPAEDTQRTFFNLSVTSLRQGRFDVLDNVLHRMEQLQVPRMPDMYTALLKMATSKRLFREALSLWERMRTEHVQVTDRAAWSCLLFAATEQRAVDLALFFFNKLQATSDASDKDFGNIIRLHASCHAARESFTLLQDMRARGLEPDSFTHNAAFAACCYGGRHLDLAEQLFATMKVADGHVDTITCNTFLKGYVQAKRIDDAFALVTEMEARNLMPSEVTFGTLLDACINEGCMDRAHEVFHRMTSSGCQMNTVLYTTMIKGFVKSKKVEKALQVYEEMRRQGVKQDSITFSLVLKALCDAGRMEQALMLFQAICAEGHQPDEIMFNNLVSGCIVCKNVPLGEKILQDMVQVGISPSCATFSTLMKLYADCEALPQAQALLKKMESQWGVVPEQRLYLQLTHTCLRMRQWHSALDVYRDLVARHGPATEAEVAKLLRACVSFNLFDPALQLATLALESRSRVGGEQLQAIADAATKKRKPAVATGVAELARRHGMHVALQPPSKE